MAEFRIFISSTFRDLSEERRLLQGVFDELRTECRGRGHELKVVDLRWGISEEEQRQGRTMEVCLGEIARCQQVSPRANFLILLGDRYGWEPAPDRIDCEEFNVLLGHMDAEAQQRVASLYSVDRNDRPASRVLDRELLASGSVGEAEVVGCLRDATIAAGWGAEDTRANRYRLSATHQEIIKGALGAEATDPEAHVFVTVRSRDRVPGPEDRRLAALEHALEQRLGNDNLFRYNAQIAGERSGPEDAQAYCLAVLHWYRGILERAMEREDRREAAMEGDGEAARHLQAAALKAQVFVGREELVSAIHDALEANEVRTIQVTGGGGSGKSAFLARVLGEFVDMPAVFTTAPREEELRNDRATDYEEYLHRDIEADNSAFFGLDKHQNRVPQDVDRIRETISAILDLEAPIHVDVLCHKVSMRWGMRSYTARTRGAMEAFLADPSLVDLDGDFCWAPRARLQIVPPRRNAPSWREGGHLHPAEIRGALIAVLESADAEGKRSVKIKTVRAEVKDLLGVRKGARQLASVVDACHDWLEGQGWRATATTFARSDEGSGIVGTRRRSPARVVFRSISATERSTNYVDLLGSISGELLPNRPGMIVEGVARGERPEDLWAEVLRLAGAEAPLILMLDGVDQLRGAPPTPHAIVPRVIPKGVRMIISTVPGGADWLPRDAGWDRVLTLPGFSDEQSRGALEGWLEILGRGLASDQSLAVMERAMEAVDGQALFIRLAAGAASRWASDTRIHGGGAEGSGGSVDISEWNGVEGIIGAELRRLDRLHTGSLASTLLSLVAASRNGLSEKEIQGCLQKLPGFWESFVGEQHVDHREALLGAGSIPDSVLLRLLGDLKEIFLVERHGLYRPAHRLIEVHAGGDGLTRMRAAEAIADHFCRDEEPWFLDASGERRAANRRKVVELPNALVAAGRDVDLVDLCLSSRDCLAATAVAHELGVLFAIEIPEGLSGSSRAQDFRARLRGAPALLLQRPSAALVDDLLSEGEMSGPPSLPKLAGLEGFRPLDVHVATGRVLFGNGGELQELDFRTGRVVRRDSGASGVLLVDEPKGWLVLLGDGSVVRSPLDRSLPTDCLSPSEVHAGADEGPVADVGEGRTLRVRSTGEPSSRSRVITLDGGGVQVVLGPAHSNVVNGLAWTREGVAGETGGLLVASAGSDRMLRVHLVNESDGESRLVHERRFSRKLEGVTFTGPNSQYLVAFEACGGLSASVGGRGSGEPLHQMWRLDTSAPETAWGESWSLLRGDVLCWPDPNRVGGSEGTRDCLWVGTMDGVLEVDPASGEDLVLVDTGGDPRLWIEIVAPGVGYAIFRGPAGGIDATEETASEQHVLFRSDKEPVTVASLGHWDSETSRSPRVMRTQEGVLACLDYSEGKGGQLVVRVPETLDVRASVVLPRPDDHGYSQFGLLAHIWAAMEDRGGGHIRLTNVSGADGVFLDVDVDGQVTGHGPRLGAVATSRSLQWLDGDGEQPPRAIRGDGGEVIFATEKRVLFIDGLGATVVLAALRRRLGVTVHQSFVAEGQFIEVNDVGVEVRRADGSLQQEEILPLGPHRHISSGPRPALIAGDGTFWFQRSGSNALESWDGGGFACLAAEGVSGGAWVVVTMNGLFRITHAGLQQQLARSVGAATQIRGCDGGFALCQVDSRLLLVSADECVELDSRSLPSGQPWLHRFEAGVILFEDQDQAVLSAWSLERGLLGTAEISGWGPVQDSLLFAAYHDEGQVLNGPRSYRCVPGGVASRGWRGWSILELPLAGCTDRLVEEVRLAPSSADWILEKPEGIPDRCDALALLPGAALWSIDGLVQRGSVVDGEVAGPTASVDGLVDAVLVASWADGVVHAYDTVLGVIRTIGPGGESIGPEVPFAGKLAANWAAGQLVVCHPSGRRWAEGRQWDQRGPSLPSPVGFTLGGRAAVTVGEEGVVVRRVPDGVQIARFRGEAWRDGGVVVDPELLLYEDDSGVFASALPIAETERAGMACATDPAGHADSVELGELHICSLLGLGSEGQVAFGRIGQSGEEWEDDSGGQFEILRLGPNGMVARDSLEGHVMVTRNGPPLVYRRKEIGVLQSDGSLLALEVPRNWWSAWPETMEVSGPDVILKLSSEGGSVGYRWASDATLSGALTYPAGWSHDEPDVQSGDVVVLRRWVEVGDGGTVVERALYRLSTDQLGQPFGGTWQFFALENGELLGISLPSHSAGPDVEAGSSTHTDGADSVRVARTDGLELRAVGEVETARDAHVVLAFDTFRQGIWVLTAGGQLRLFSAKGEMARFDASEIYRLEGIAREQAWALSIEVLPGEVLVRRRAENEDGRVLSFEMATGRGAVDDLLASCDKERLVSIQVTRDGRYVLLVEDRATASGKHEQFLVRAGRRAASGEMEFIPAAYPMVDRRARVIPLEAGIAVVSGEPAGMIYRLLSWEDLRLMRSEVLVGGICRVEHEVHTVQGVYLLGDGWAAHLAEDGGPDVRTQVWSPVVRETALGPPLPASAVFSESAISVRFEGGSKAVWGRDGALRHAGSEQPSGLPLRGLPVSIMVRDGQPTVIGGEGGQIWSVAEDVQSMTPRVGLGCDEATRTWQVLGLHEIDKGHIVAVYRSGGVDLVELEGGTVLRSWEPRTRSGDIRTATDLACASGDGVLFLRLDEEHLKVMDLRGGRVWRMRVAGGAMTEISAFGAGWLAVGVASHSVRLVRVSSALDGPRDLPVESSVEGSRLLPEQPGRSWTPAIQTGKGMLLPGGAEVLPVGLDGGGDVVASVGGRRWASLHRKKLTVVDDTGQILLAAKVGRATISRKRPLQRGSRLDRGPLGISPEGGTIALLLDEDGGAVLRLIRVLDGREQTLVGVTDCWFEDEQCCLLVRGDGALERFWIWSDEAPQRLTLPSRDVLQCVELPRGRMLAVMPGRARVFEGVREVDIHPIELEPLDGESLARVCVTPCGEFLAEGRQQGVISVYRLSDGSELSPPVLFEGGPEWSEVRATAGRVWGLTTSGQVLSREWEPW